jgi:hypothetical protein
VTAAAGFSNAGTITSHHRLALIGDISNIGTIDVAPNGHIECAGALGASGDSGGLTLSQGSVASLDAVSNGQTITFTGNGRLRLHRPQAFNGVIAGFKLGDTIELDTLPIGPLSYGSGKLTFALNGSTVALALNGSFNPAGFVLTSLPNGRALISYV